MDINETKFYNAALHYLLTENELKENSYPRFNSPGRVFIQPDIFYKYKKMKMFVPDNVMDRVCCRCDKDFKLSAAGAVVKGKCVYHLRGKPRFPGAVHACCGSANTEAGCQQFDSHVSETLRDSILNQFVTAPAPEGPFDSRSNKVFAIDCEMIHTVWGLALARLTVVGANEEVVMDELIKPECAVIDYNTRYSGITATDLEAATMTLKTARARLFELINTQSILIGHSLDHDLESLLMVHDRVVDSVVMFPHPIKKHIKRSLKELVMEKLGTSIQQNAGGHSSTEDARAALKLVIHKARTDKRL